MRLIFLINAFNEAMHIDKCIKSVHDVADEIWLFDGAYKNYPHKHPHSTDGMLDIAKKYSKVKIYKVTTPYKDQLEKRTAMFKDGQEGDFFFKLDGDEYITNPEIIREYLTPEIDVGWVWTISNLYPKPIMTARIFKYQEGLHYAGRHHWIYNGKNEFVTSDQHMNPKFNHKTTQIRLFNFRDSSSTKRRRDKKQFLVNRNPKEASFKREDKVYPDKFTRLIQHPNRAGECTELLGFTIREGDRVKYTLSGMISREWALKKFFSNLAKMELPKDIEAVFVIDSKNSKIKFKVLRYFQGDKRFKTVKIFMTGRDKLPEFASVLERRQRIVDNWHIILTNMKGDILLASEDDSLPQSDAYTRLLKVMEDEKADFVQGNIIGRWNAKICPAWRILEKKGSPYLVWNEKEQESGLTEIQGCGWYCFVSPADVVRKYQMYVDNITPLGPDLSFGYQLSKNGFKLLHCWDVKVEHFAEQFNLVIGRDETEQKMWVKDGEKWVVKNFSKKKIEEALKEGSQSL
jgi:glycosyltransferase involved in cell wall biosynthesis